MAVADTVHAPDCACVWCSLKRDLENAYKPAPKPAGPTAAEKADLMTTHPVACDCVWCDVARQVVGVGSVPMTGGGTVKKAEQKGEYCIRSSLHSLTRHRPFVA